MSSADIDLPVQRSSRIVPALLTLGGGILLALMAAGAVRAWTLSPVPVLLVLTPVLQGLGLGFGLGWLVRGAMLRDRKTAAMVGLLCGTLSVFAVHYGDYRHEVRLYREELLSKRAELMAKAGPEAAQAMLGPVDRDPFAAYDAMALRHTGSHGVVGHQKRRAAQGIHIRRLEVKGAALWTLWAVEAVVVIGIAGGMSYARAANPTGGWR